MKIITITYKSTFYYFIDSGEGLLAFDAGWPDTYRMYKDCLKAEGYQIKDIKWLIVSHFHMDHAGIAGMLADKEIEFYVFQNQLYAIEEMENLIKSKEMPYHSINMEKVIIQEIITSRNLLANMGIAGEILHTNGHSEDSVSLLLDTGEAFIGDLAPEMMLPEDDQASKNCWEMLKTKGAKKIYTAHAGEFVLG